MKREPHTDFWFWLLLVALVAVCFSINTCSGAECQDGVCVQTTPALVPGPLGKLRIKQAVPLVPAKLKVRYGWYRQESFQPQPYGGVAGEVLSRVRSDQWYRHPDIGTTTHETCHQLNSNLRNSLYAGIHHEAAYMPGGYVILLPRTGLRMADYAVKSRSLIASFQWSDGTPVDAIDLIDEYSCYLCGMAARIENHDKTDSLPSGDFKRGMWLEEDLQHLRNKLAMLKWPYVRQLDELLVYGHSKYEEYAKRLP